MNEGSWKILLVDDDEDDYVLVRDWLETAKHGEHRLQWANTYESALQVFEAETFDAILVDYDLGGHNGLELTNEIVRRGYTGPTIILTGRGDYALDLEAMKAGATEYLSKNETSPRLLERTIRYAIEHQRNMEAVRKANEQLAQARDHLELRVQERTEDLRRNNQQLQAILTNTPLILWAIDLNKIVTFAEGKVLADFGVPTRDWIGHPVFDYISSEPKVGENIRRAMTGEYVVGTVTSKIVPGHIFEVHFTPQRNSRGEIVGVIGLQIDVTERIAQEARLRDYHRRNEALAQLSQDLAQLGRDSRAVIETVSRRVVEWIGDTCTISLVDEDTRQLRAESFYHPDPRAAAFLQEAYTKNTYHMGRGLTQQVIESGQPLRISEVDRKQLVAQASPVFVDFLKQFGVYSVLIAPMRAQDKTIGALGISRTAPGRPYSSDDEFFLLELGERTAFAIENARLFSLAHRELSERRRMEQALRESQALFEHLFESAPDATLLVDSLGKIEKLNQQTVQVFGYIDKDLIGQPFTTLIAREYHSMVTELLEATSRQGEIGPHLLEKDIAGQRLDGLVFPIEMVQAPFRLATTSGVICVIHDITARKKMEAELAEVPRRLFESVEAERLRLAKDLHDGPIQEMYGLAFGLRAISNEIDHDDLVSIGRIEEMLKRLYETIQTMRDLSRLLRPPTLSPFGLEKTLRSHIEQFHEEHPEIEIETQLQPDNLEIPEGLRLVLFRIFQNALSNVIRHAAATRIKVRLSLDEREVMLEVQDNGRGFDFTPRWVDLVRQGHLGLAGANERAEAIGGRLDILTGPGRGTLVRVTAPLPRPDPAQLQPVDRPVLPA